MKLAFSAGVRSGSGRTRKRNGSVLTGAGLPGGRSTRRRGNTVTRISAGTAAQRFKQTGSGARTAPSPALPTRAERRPRMSDELRTRVIAYKTAVAILKEMVKKGVITEADLAVAEVEIARKYGIKTISIFR